jgi:metallo-beta-lactamase class B
VKRVLARSFFAFVCLAGWFLMDLQAQTRDAAQEHVAAAKAAAYRPGHDFNQNLDVMCATPKPAPANGQAAGTEMFNTNRTISPRSKWYVEPHRVFDNLYYVGSSYADNESVWAVITSGGIILIDSGYDYSVQELVVNGLKKLGQDPAQIKYVILSHPSADRYFGSKYIQSTYHARVVLSEADWNALAKSNVPAEFKPQKDIVATDGMEVTLGDTTLTLYITPGISPGAISSLIPLKDGNQTHLGYVIGGRAWLAGRDGVQYFPDESTSIRTWLASIRRFHDIAVKAGADVLLSIHPQHDRLFNKIDALKAARAHDPKAAHPFVSKQALENYTTVMTECMEAQLIWRAAGRSN